MQTGIMVLFVLTTSASVLFASPGNSQDIEQVEISLELKNESLTDAFKKIEAKSAFYFMYRNEDVKFISTITIKRTKQSIASFLKIILSNTSLTFKQVNNHILITRINSYSGSENKEHVSNTTTVADGGGIKGKTIAENGLPLPGVTVKLEGGKVTQTKITDENGNYVFSDLPAGNYVITFSNIGFIAITKNITLSEGQQQAAGNTVLKEDYKKMNDVVVVGYGTQFKRNVISSISSIKGSEIQNIPVSQADALLQGKAAGVQVVQNSGAPGGEVFVRVRGTASLRADSRPLYVIDGVPMINTDRSNLDGAGQRTSALSDINPNDIESMDILKDASATAIYGARGSNGVVLITTKRGKEGKARINLDVYYGIQEVTRRYDLLNGSQFTEILKEAIANRNALTANPTININTPAYTDFLKINAQNTNYQNEIFRTAPTSNYNLSVAGGQDKLKSFVSLGVFNQQGTIIGQDYTRISGRANLDYQATSKLKIGNTVTFSNAKMDRIVNDYSQYSILGNAILRNPNLPVKNSNGTYGVDPLGQNGLENPVVVANDLVFKDKQRRLLANVYGEYKIIPELTFKSVFGIDNFDVGVQRFVPSNLLRANGRASAEGLRSETASWINDNTLNYNKSFADHHISVLAGLGLQRNKQTFLQAGGNTAGSDIITTIATSVADLPLNFITEWALLSYFGRANYNFSDKYFFEGSFRVDASSRFGKNKANGLFPAASIAWRVTSERFMENIKFINDLKLRVGIGTTGNQDGLGNYSYQTLYGTGRNYNNLPGIAQANVRNEDLGWESTTTTNLGLDIALLNSRISFTADAYLKKTKDLLFPRQLPWTSGFSEIGNVNVGKLENRGIEFALSTYNLVGKFKWSTNFNISFNRNRITDLPTNGSQGSDIIFKLNDAYSVEGPYNIYRVGQSVGSFYGYQYLGVYARDEDVPVNLRSNDPLNGYRGGFPIFVDRDNNGIYDRINDRMIIGNALPKHTGGITNNFSYGPLQLSVVMNWSYGNDVYNITRAVLTSTADDFNQSTEVLGRWQKQGDVTNMPKAMYLANSFRGVSFTDFSSRFLEDGSFLRIRNVTLSYMLPAQVLRKAKINSVRIYVSGQNVYTFTKYTGLDPESQNTGGGLVPVLGVDYLTQPLPRVFTFGFNIGL